MNPTYQVLEEVAFLAAGVYVFIGCVIGFFVFTMFHAEGTKWYNAFVVALACAIGWPVVTMVPDILERDDEAR